MSAEDIKLIDKDTYIAQTNKIVRVLRHNGAGTFRGKHQFTYPELKEIANDGDFFDYFSIGDILTPSKETGVTVVSSNAGLTVTISEDTFLTWVTDHAEGVAQRDYELIYDGLEWHLGEDPIVLSTMGVSISSGTPVAEDKIVIHEAASVVYFRVAHRKADGHAILVSVFCNLTNAQFCAAQKLHVFANGLAAGTYKFTLDHGSYGGSTGADGSYVFTITQAIPAGGWLRINSWGFWKSTYSVAQFLNDARIKTYNASGTEIETVAPAAFDSQVFTEDLGKYSARKAYYTEAELAYKNGMEQQGAGYNEYIDSAIDQWANSSAKKAQWFTPRNVFDVKPNFADSADGFMHGLDDEFIECLRLADRTTIGETVWNNRGSKTIKRKFFLLTNKEVGFTSYADEGEYLDWFAQFGVASNGERADRIFKTTGGSAQYVWTATALRDYACREYVVQPTGSCNIGTANNAIAVVLACEI